MQKMLLFVFGLFFSFCGHAQFTRYIIKFRDKGTNPFSISNPSQYLSQRALDRRTRYNIAIDSSDLPVTPRYIDSLRLAGNVTIINVSKWLNQVAIQTSDDVALDKINNFAFVESASPIAARNSVSTPVNKSLDLPAGNIITTGNTTQSANGYYNYGQSADQIKIHHGDFLHNHGFRGEGMMMAVLDAGFFHYLSLPTFDSIRNNNQVLGTWDFVDNETSVDEDYYHGMQCLSTIAANIPGSFIGTAPKTSFYLFRTEDVNSEYPIEEQNWAAGLEKADSLGVDITSTSLGYTQFDNSMFNHTYADMNGNTTIGARAADLAAKKGMLVVCAAGNEGNSGWHYITTPSDADSVLCVGAVNTSGDVAGFSSYGPASDGQIKPSVAAVGWNAVVASPSDGLPSFNSGTSFACPNMAGITTCLWQAFPEVNNMSIIEALELSATRPANPDDRMGYGIPDVKKAFVMLLRRGFGQQSSIIDCKADIEFHIKSDATMTVDVERKLPADPFYTTITTLQDNGNFAMHNFSFSDSLADLSMGDIQYRLRMNIAADTSFYLDSALIHYAESCGIPSQNNISIGPNPVQTDLKITISRTTEAKVDIVIQNALGQRVYKNSFQQQAGIQSRAIPMQMMSRGMYFVTVYINNKKEITKKIIR